MLSTVSGLLILEMMILVSTKVIARTGKGERKGTRRAGRRLAGDGAACGGRARGRAAACDARRRSQAA